MVQDVHNPHNISACIRSADAFGIQCVDVVNLHQKFQTSSVCKGVDGWLNIQNFSSIKENVDFLRSRNFKFAAGMPPSDKTIDLEAIPLEEPLAIVFGNEHDGVHDAWREHIDYEFTIPMVGMVESLNISVSAAICMQRLSYKAKHEFPDRYFLNEERQRELRNQWISKHFSLTT